MVNAEMVFEFSDVVVAGANGSTRLSIDHLNLPQKGITAIVGPSGSGKSTLLRLCNRLEIPTSGELRFMGSPLHEQPVQELRRLVGMVFQEPVRFAGTVFDNLLVADDALDQQQATSLLERVGLNRSFLDRVADDLSGGEAQRMCIARALATRPRMLLMDEPTSALDPAATTTIEEQATDLSRDGMPILWVTHDTAQMARIASHVVCLADGRMVFEGNKTGFFKSDHPSVAAYLSGRSQ
jgi:putative ABC transport system ATP-binding protein